MASAGGWVMGDLEMRVRESDRTCFGRRLSKSAKIAGPDSPQEMQRMRASRRNNAKGFDFGGENCIVGRKLT